MIFFRAAAAEAPLIQLPLFLTPVACGFPSPAQDYIEQTLDLNELCVARPAATYYVRAQGDSMINAGIHDGDLLIVDRSITAQHGDTIIASLGGEFTVKELRLRPSPALLPANPEYRPILLDPEQELEVFGVVVYVLHKQFKR